MHIIADEHTRKVYKLIRDVIEERFIILNAEAKDWKEAIHQSATPLKEAGYITDSYEKEMIRVTEAEGAYYVILPHIAMPHASPEKGVLRNCLSIMTLRQPVCFHHAQHDPVKYIFCLAASNGKEHLENMSDLVNLFESQAFFELLDHAESPKEVIAYIQNGNSEVEGRK